LPASSGHGRGQTRPGHHQKSQKAKSILDSQETLTALSRFDAEIRKEESPPSSLPSHVHSHKSRNMSLVLLSKQKRQPPFQVFSHKTSLSTRIATHTASAEQHCLSLRSCQQIRLADKTMVNHYHAVTTQATFMAV